MTSDPTRQQVPYQQLAQALLTQIRNEEFKPGDRLPSTAQLAATHGMATGTVQRALADLRRRGVIYSQAGRGSFVSSPEQELAKERSVADLAQELDELRKRVELLERTLRTT
ncbi:GntR family transcriptional regulator [Kitasatospora sp. NPDC001527]|uniref:GntR family transcriptional regulator n=1 Tax=Kitasatospora sp. NPDC001527 TaxID=3154519 RepID=UPI00332C7DFD